MTRKSSKVSEARKKAELAAQKIQEKQAKLLSLAEEYFSVTAATGIDDLEAKIAEHQAQIQTLQQKIQDAHTETQNKQSLAVQKMKAEGISNSEIAERLALSSSEVSSLLKIAKELIEVATSKTESVAQDADQEQTD
ncbi:hypothetical protein E4U03_03780 [Rothia nasimurium]|uniref:Uncharacterized protein n=1 Tax=Rothia nasimurium TaxID=85336 RepID=A0A4Y9F502_9MICC|nr:hypothetical protein [Rothia nasimurium]MBF0807738.1 hypothetical protein [Rothia nasimurium]TFU23255.1 hypothetical protein E4U03_03780 [Rothia nasimurium]